MFIYARILFAMLFAVILSFATAVAGDVGKPVGPVLLTVEGHIANTNGDGVAKFDEALLKALGLKTIVTSTTWTKGKSKFQGVLARDVIKAVGGEGASVDAVAVNNYKITIPLSDFEKYDVLFAMELDGKKLTRRDKGPIWIIYPRDAHPELRNEKTDAKSIWQLVKLEIR